MWVGGTRGRFGGRRHVMDALELAGQAGDWTRLPCLREPARYGSRSRRLSRRNGSRSK